MPAADAPRLVRYRDTWAVYYQRRRISTGSTERAAADQFLADFKAALAAPKAKPGELAADLLAAYLANRKDRNKPGAERLEWAHKPLVRHLGTRDPAYLTEPDFHAYTKKRLADGVAESTVRTELQALRAAMRWRLGGTAPRVDMPSRPVPRDRWLTRDEADKLLSSCERRHIRMFIMLGLHTAARSAAILGLTWDRVDLTQRRIDYREPGARATRKRRVPVPINDDLLPELVTAKERAETDYVIEWAGGRVESVKRGLAYTAARAGVPGVTPHVLRHTAATWMLQAGIPPWQVAGMLGHSDTRMVTETYGHHSPDHLRDAAASLRKQG